jgi:putative membrane protein
MAYIRYLILIIVGFTYFIFCFANQEIVTLSFLPHEFQVNTKKTLSVDVPIFIVLSVGLLIGLILGFTLEWFRNLKSQRLRRKSADKKKTERTRSVIRSPNGKNQDELLELLDDN